MTSPLSARPIVPLHAPLLLAALLLGACSQDSTPVANPAQPASYAAVARGRVDVEGGLLALRVPRDGTLAMVAVHEGDRVRQGQILATLANGDAQLAVAAAQAELDQAQAQARALEGKHGAAQLRARRLREAAKAGAGDGQSADDAQDAANQLDAEQQAAQAAVAIGTTRLAQARYELGLRTLRAPIAADVVQVAAQPGAGVSPQSGALFTLLPLTPPIVRAELSEAYIGAVKVGMPAEVSADDRAGQHWRAHVLRVGRVIGPSPLEDDPQARATTRTVPCVLAFDQPQDLRIGQRVLVRFGSTTPAPTPAKD
jgi:multidrug efflux pump subunit AcrA (membrane-fusion protein)